MRRRGLALAVAGALIALAVWLVARPTKTSAPQRIDGDDVPARATDVAPPSLAPGGASESATASPREPTWWVEGSVARLDRALDRAVVEVRWWSKVPASEDAVPERVFRSPPVALGNDPKPFRVEGEGGGVVLVETTRGVEDASPFVAHPRFSEVLPGRGIGGWTIEVGTTLIEGTTVDRQGAPVARVAVTVRDLTTDRARRAVTDGGGRFRLTGFHGDRVGVALNCERALGTPVRDRRAIPEFADVAERVVAIGADPIRVVVPRNPRVVLHGRAAAFPRAVCAPGTVRVHGVDGTQSPGGWTLYDAEGGSSLQPGRWRLSTDFSGVAGSVDTPVLALDDDVTLHVDLEIPPAQAAYALSYRGVSEDAARGCAVEARGVGASGGWSGTRASGGGAAVLLVLHPGAYELTGGVKVGGEVRVALPTPLDVRAGDRRSIELTVERAGAIAIAIEATPDSKSGVEHLSLEEHSFPGSGVFEDPPMRMAWLVGRPTRCEWWMRPGKYTVLRRDNDDEVKARTAVVVEAGKVTAVDPWSNR